MGQCPIGRNPSTTVPAPELTEDLIEEILLRFPPGEPASLVRVALVCKQWCRLISEPHFRRSFREFHLRSREFHRTPRMLGFFCSTDGGSETARFVPTSTFRSPRAADLRHCRAIDARHGRVLLQCPGKAPSETVLVVWDPISDERRELLAAPTWWGQESRWRYGWNAAVLCAATAGTCDHLDCHREPFLVVLVDSHYCPRNLFTSTYSSDSGTWCDRIFPIEFPYYYMRVSSLPCAHVGNSLYFGSESSDIAVKYDLCLHEVTLISIPLVDEPYPFAFPYMLTATEDGGLRYTGLHRSKLYVWLRDDVDGPNVDGRRTRWTQDRVIELKWLFLSNAMWASRRILGFADEAPRIDIVGFAGKAGVIFLTADDVLFTVDLYTKKVKKVFKNITVGKALPYMSFCSPALGAAFSCEGPSEGGSNA